MTHDNGPPYNSHAWRNYAKQMGFETRPCTPEHPEGNPIAERFMGVLVKVVHTAQAQGLDPKVEVHRRLLNYRNTPHPSTGKTPAELIMGRRLRSKVPSLVKPGKGKVLKEARTKDKETKVQQKEVFDKRKRAVLKKVQPGDKVLIKQQKSSVKPPYDPKPYTVTKVKSAQVTAERGTKTRVRDMSKVKVVVSRPVHLRSRRQEVKQGEDSDSEEEDFLDVKTMLGRRPQEEQIREEEGQQRVLQPQGQEQEERYEQQEAPEQEMEQEQEARQTPARRNRRPPVRYQDQVYYEGHYSSSKQPSPKQRKRAQGAAKYKKRGPGKE